MATTAPTRPAASTGQRASLKRMKFLIPLLLLAVVGAVVANVLMSTSRTPPTSLGGSASVEGGLAHIQGVIPTETDGWMPPKPSTAFASPPADELHRVRILLELTVMEESGLSFDPAEYAVSTLGGETWKAVWSAPAPTQARQGETIDATLVFELPDQAIDLTLEVPDGGKLSLGPGHHRG
ncbi:hypothetical protein [Arthrobacter pityocampae]|uniref:hypothetical protein n=1 Tax=Arthrobacter pityocampae TaxID=547334 RepID=UPI003735D837